MGNTQTLELAEVAERRESKQYGGRGLFATCDIIKGTLLRGNKEIHRGMMNDADFEYPSDFTLQSLTESFAKYKSKSKRSVASDRSHSSLDECSCNTTEYGNENIYTSLVTKDIKKGDELTKYYGFAKWLYFLWSDIKDKNPTRSHKICLKNEDEAKALANLVKSLTQLGFKVEIPKEPVT